MKGARSGRLRRKAALAIAPLDPILFEPLLIQALREDLGGAGDITTDAVVPADLAARAALIAREPGRIAGLDVALHVFRLLDPAVKGEARIRDGDDVKAGQALALVRGRAGALLKAERVALNILARLSGIATATREAVKRIEGSAVKICCTRKTTPGLRALEKYAVRVGGGFNHRFGLDDAALIKDNHRSIAGGLTEAVMRARARLGHMVKIEVEADGLADLREALASDADAILLDNMSPHELRQAVKVARRVKPGVVLEASGGIRFEDLASVAASGVDIISLGQLTHSTPALDIALDVLPRR
jgi:nicotinate-nucleotide pyrophosphorylase (carboxylating)